MAENLYKLIGPKWLFVSLLLITAVLYNYPSILFKRPQSTHHWRQADCASLTLMYYQNGMKFFEPQTHNLTSDNNITGYVAPSELPIFYYFIAILYKIFGYHDYIYRTLNTLIFLFGLYYLFKLFQLVSSSFWGIVGALLFFTSPVLSYYGNNFLTNSSSLSLSIIGWYLFFLYRKQGSQKYFYWSIAMFGLACCMKISAGFSYFAVFAIFLFEKVKIYKEKEGRVFPRGILPWAMFLVSIAIPLSWIFYADHYNKIHDTGYFSTGIFPLWDMESKYIERVKVNVAGLWRDQYFSDASLIFFGVIFLIQIALAIRSNRFIFTVIILMLLEAVVYVFLQFMTFADHDYYTIDLFIILIFIFINTLVIINKLKPTLLANKYIQIGFVCFLLYNVYHCKTQMRLRYEGWWNEYPVTRDFHTVKPFLRQLGIAPMDTVVIIPEYSYFIHYLTNQRGWIRYADEEDPRKNSLLVAEDSVFIKKCIDSGGKYLFVLNAEKTLKIMPAFKKYTEYLMGKYGNVSVYALKDSFRKPFKSSQKIISDILFDSEKANSEFFFSKDGRYIAAGTDTRTREQKYSGDYGVKLSGANAYAFTTEIKDVAVGEEFIISVFRKGINGTIVASGVDPGKFYYSTQEIIKNTAEGWDSLSMKFRITYKLPQRRLKLYLWNDKKDSTYFDNFRIIRKEGWNNKELL